MAYDLKLLAQNFIATRKASYSARIALQEANRDSTEKDTAHKNAELALQEIAQNHSGQIDDIAIADGNTVYILNIMSHGVSVKKLHLWELP